VRKSFKGGTNERTNPVLHDVEDAQLNGRLNLFCKQLLFIRVVSDALWWSNLEPLDQEGQQVRGSGEGPIREQKGGLVGEIRVSMGGEVLHQLHKTT